jgi:hypothetical protein
MGNQRARVGVLCDTEEINGPAFQVHAIRAKLPFTIDRFHHASFYLAAKDSSFLKTMYKDYDYVITLSDWAPFKRFLGEFIPLDDIEQAMVNQFNDHVEKNHFTLFRSFRLPDSSDVLVYKHRKRVVENSRNRLQKEDNDYDGISNEKDNCINNPNGPNEGVCTSGYTGEICKNNYECGADGFCSMSQEDVDQDGFGDVCDFCKGNGNKDSDQDGLCDPEDNCYYVFNPDQQDSSGNGVGDACIPSHIENHWLEAEQADVIVNPLEVVYDEKASEGSYIYSPNGTGNQSVLGFVMAIYRVNISNTGVYVLWGRVKAINGRENSFFVQIDDGSNNLWEIEVGNYWHWDVANDRDRTDPVKFVLTKGVHTIKVKLREKGTKLDKLVLTNNVNFVPSSKGDIVEKTVRKTEGDDDDGISNEKDNCPKTFNPIQEDTYPPQGNDIGDACDCEGDFNCDGSVNAADSLLFLKDFAQRTKLDNPCTNKNQCNGDFDCDGDVDEDDRTIFQADLGRNQFFKPCPPCVAGSWCVYP